MKPGFKFFSITGATALLCCSWCVFLECGAVGAGIGSSFTTEQIAGVVGVFSTIFAGSQYASAIPPSLFRKRLGSPMPQIGRPISLDDEEDSDEDEDELLNDQSQPRVEPHITPLNRDQCLAKLLCGMSVPVTGGNSKKNYYSEYANIVSKFFEAFPLDEELQSKESIETYDDYSNEDDGKPIRMNNRRKPLNSSRVDATAPTLQLFDLALVDIAKPEDVAKNRTRKAAFEKRIARARRIVENLGQKLQTVRQCQSISGCPFSFKQLREKIKRKETQRISSNVSLPPGPPVWPVNPKRQNDQPAPATFQPKFPPQSRPRPVIRPSPKPESQSGELFSNEEPVFPYKDTNKGDDEIEEIFGPPPVSKKPLGFHQGVDENFNYDYNPDKPWRPGSSGGNSYSHRPWNRPSRPQPKPFSRPGGGGNNDEGHQRLPPRPRPRPGGNNPPGSQKRYPPQRQNQQQQQHQQNRRPAPASKSPPPQPKPKKPTQPPTTTTTTTARSTFPKKKISYLNSPYSKPSTNTDEDDEGSEDINKVAPVELIGNSDAGENEQAFKKTTAKPVDDDDDDTEAPKYSVKKKKTSDDDDDSDEYDDDYDDDYEDDEDALDDEDEDEYSDEEEDDKESAAKKKKQKEKKEKKKKNKQKKKKVKEDDKETSNNVKQVAASSVTKIKKINSNSNPYFDDENADIDEIWTKLNYATTGANYKPLEKLKKKEESTGNGDEEVAAAASEEEDGEVDDDDEDEEDEVRSSAGLQKTRASSSSASSEDDADDEVDDENESKPKRSKSKSKSKVKVGSEKQENDEQVAADIAEAAPESGKQEKDSGKKGKKKNKKDKKKPAKKGSSEEEDDSAAARRKQIMMEIGGRPLVPKPESDQTNTKKTSSLISNRFKFQFINPYGPAPPSDVNLPGAYTPLRTSYGPTSAPSGGGSAISSLPFKFNINPGALGSLVGGGAGGGGMGPMSGFPNMGSSSSSSSGSIEMPDPHHPPPSNGYIPPPPQMQPHQQRQEYFQHSPPNLSGGSIGGSSLFKFQNPLPALSNLFKRPSAASFDPMLSGPDGHGPPPVSSFVHRPVGPESSHYKRERPSPASGSSDPARSSISLGSNGATGTTKKSSKSKASKGKKGKL